MNKDNYFKLFAKIYFVIRKNQNNITLNDFRNWSSNELFCDFFDKLNVVLVKIGYNIIKPKYNQKKRLYSLFRNIVSYTYYNR